MASTGRKSRRGMGMTNRSGQSSSSELAAAFENEQARTPTRKVPGMAAPTHEFKPGGSDREEIIEGHADTHSPQMAVANRSSNFTPHSRSTDTAASKRSQRSKSRGGHDIQGWHKKQIGKKLEQAKRDFL
eukprot:2432402-Rhodomonas_salina.3